MDPARQLAKLLEGLGELLRGAVQELGSLIGVRLQLRLGESQGKGERDEALLRAVVKVAFEAPAFGVARLQEALARMAQLLLLPLALGDLHPGDEEVGAPMLVEERRRRPGDDRLAPAGRAPVVLMLAGRALGRQRRELAVHVLG